MIAMLVGLATVGMLAVPAAGDVAANESLSDVPAIRLEQSAELGIPLCPPDSFDAGYATAEELAGAIEAAGGEACVSRSEVVFATDRPTPSANHQCTDCEYHYVGYETSGSATAGARGSLQVRDIDNLCHNGECGTKFVANRVFVMRFSGGQLKWVEAGWYEATWTSSDDRVVYTFGTQCCGWIDHLSYSLSGGNYYGFQVKHLSGNLNAYILSGSSWQLLWSYSSPSCVTGGGDDACKSQWRVEVYSDQDGEHPTWTNRINVDDAERKKNGSWGLVTGGVDAAADTPYSLCVTTYAYDWGAVKGSC